MKKIVVFGSTGAIGLCAVEAALKKGFSVRAFVRDPAKLPEDLKSKVEVFEGNVLEPDSVQDAVEGTEGVVIALGTRNNLAPTSDLSEGTKNIIEAMRAKNVKNVSACISAFLFYEADKVAPIFVDITADHKRMYTALKESPLNWVAVFPPHFTGRTISKIDLGTFLVDALDEPKYYKAVIGICNVPK
ncbi:hypothetical protein O3G_MSEX002122 [Manduca sexta]|uniref:NAD(P)-binding domain-containing protein n=1 Tax=Manduca sexta TaxID=7130 RepID=A0A921YMK9_MANSE|nr:hypothetical protein O3G_MSEX002122 [Manduca sexta]